MVPRQRRGPKYGQNGKVSPECVHMLAYGDGHHCRTGTTPAARHCRTAPQYPAVGPCSMPQDQASGPSLRTSLQEPVSRNQSPGTSIQYPVSSIQYTVSGSALLTPRISYAALKTVICACPRGPTSVASAVYVRCRRGGSTRGGAVG